MLTLSYIKTVLNNKYSIQRCMHDLQLGYLSLVIIGTGPTGAGIRYHFCCPPLTFFLKYNMSFHLKLPIHFCTQFVLSPKLSGLMIQVNFSICLLLKGTQQQKFV